jgi:hypothetical protein
MAAKHSSKPKLVAVATRTRNETADLKERAGIVERATWQLASIVEAIKESALKNDFEELPVNGKLLALALRAEQLNDLIGATVSEHPETIVRCLHRLGEGDVTDAEAANG